MAIMKPLLINNLEFAVSEQIVSGSVELTSLQRLNDLLVLKIERQQTAKIHFTLIGEAKKFSQPSLHLTIDAELPAICQRCLNEMKVPLKLDFDYLISDSEPAGFDESDDLDWLESAREMHVWEVIEDELLIAFPIAPVHSAVNQQECIQYTKQSGEKPNPFAVLKDFAKKSS
ncbi:YceD family protein [Methylotenera versatilis]|nr:YceD family protein [Methylotenera versatilis]